jgi:hypothetical protein
MRGIAAVCSETHNSSYNFCATASDLLRRYRYICVNTWFAVVNAAMIFWFHKSSEFFNQLNNREVLLKCIIS